MSPCCLGPVSAYSFTLCGCGIGKNVLSHAPPEELPWMFVSKMTLDDIFKETGVFGISTRQVLDKIAPSDQFLGLQLPLSFQKRSPQISVFKTTVSTL